MRILICLLLALSYAALAQSAPTAGTTVPVMLNQTVNSAHARPGSIVRARLMQEVRWSASSKINAGATLVGQVTRIDRGPNGVRISIRFDHLEARSKEVPVTTSLRALASYVGVAQSQVPPTGTSRAVPYDAATLVLVGGDVSYRGGGPVMHGPENVGKPSGDGVLVRVLPNPERGCTTPVDSSTEPQSLWVFSSDACGAYGLPKVSVADRGLNSGEFTLTSPGTEIELHSGDGLLLTVITPAR
jgi:hypothetical protein